jgi:hypothetical protein
VFWKSEKRGLEEKGRVVNQKKHNESIRRVRQAHRKQAQDRERTRGRQETGDGRQEREDRRAVANGHITQINTPLRSGFRLWPFGVVPQGRDESRHGGTLMGLWLTLVGKKKMKNSVKLY